MNRQLSNRELLTEEECLRRLEKARWNGSPVCPYCGSTRSTPIPESGRYRCNQCNTTYSATVKTMFAHTHQPLHNWFAAIAMLAKVEENPPPARRLGQILDVNKDTARSMIGRIIEAMSDPDEHQFLQRLMEPDAQIPRIFRATHGSPDRPLKLGAIEIPCYVLDNGMRVLSGRGLQGALGLGQSHGHKMRQFFEAKPIKPIINNKLTMTIDSPVRFVRAGRGGRLTVGYEATILADICDALLQARKDGLLTTEKQLRTAEQCEMLTRAFAKVGIIALVDEATGYQENRDREELQKLLALYISEELLPWAKTFPDEFYCQLFKLQGWPYSPLNTKRPRLVGKITSDIVYERLPPGVLEQLRMRNPVVYQDGRQKHKHFQFLTDDLGQPHLKNHLVGVIALMRAAPNWKNFKRMLERAYPKEGGQYELALPESPADMEPDKPRDNV